MRKKISKKDVWNLDNTFYEWLYEGLKRYIKIAIVDLNYRKFEYKGKQYTQRQMINMMIERLEFYFSPEYDYWDCLDTAYVQETAKIWAIVLPYMWS